jgi:hypothetical protein
LSIEIADSLPQDLTAKAWDLLSGPGVEELDAGSDDAVWAADWSDEAVGELVVIGVESGGGGVEYVGGGSGGLEIGA